MSWLAGAIASLFASLCYGSEPIFQRLPPAIASLFASLCYGVI